MKLIEGVKKLVSKADRTKYTTRAQKLNWKEVKIDNFTPDECQQKFAELLRSARKFRNLYEVVEELSEGVRRCPHKKPLTSYQLFLQDNIPNERSGSTSIVSGAAFPLIHTIIDIYNFSRARQ